MKYLSATCFLLYLWGMMGGEIFAQRKATILDHKDRIRIQRMDVLNSRFRETNLSITPDGKYLYFMSMRGGQYWSNTYMTFKGDSVYDGDIWYAEKVGEKWSSPKNMPRGINTSQGEDEPNISADGKTVYFQSWNHRWKETGGPYYKATRFGSTWTRPEGLGGGITAFFDMLIATDGMTVSPDEKKLIVAAGLDYDRDMDIYMSKKSTYGWTYCKRLPISTSGDDRSVFLAADGKTLYFASDGYDGFGGLDIYKTTMNSDGTFGEVVNVGKPFNTSGDDYGLILSGDGLESYFVRDGDIYFADLKDADERIKPTIPTIVHTLAGTVRDSISWRGLSAEIVLLDARSKRIVKKINTNNSGKYSVELPNKTRVYDVIVIGDGYPKIRRRINVSQQSVVEKYVSNFLLAKPGATRPVEEPIASAEPPVKVVPTPEEPVIPKVEEIEKPKETAIIEAPIKQAPIITVEEPDPDPYSFDGIAENNLILLLDVSASMNKPEKLPLLKNSFKKLLDHMRPEDQISVIVYSGEAKVVLDGVSAVRKETIISAIENIRSGGATKGKMALRKAYRIAESNFIPGGNNRMILATDGFFDVEDLYNIAEKNATRGVSLSVFSFGKLAEEKIKELEDLAQIGNGNYAGINRKNVEKALLAEAKAVRK